MRHSKAVAWEEKLKKVFDEIDGVLENEYGKNWRLHPSRPEKGSTSNPEDDGLFNVGASFTAGYGSSHGAGYTVEIRLSTLDRVPPEIRSEIRNRVSDLLKEKLPQTFPDQQLEVVTEGTTLKIVGNLNLGSR